MDAKVLIASSYEDAVEKARDAYGDRVRILRRRDIVQKGFLGLGRTSQCEITFHVADRPARRSKAATAPPSKAEAPEAKAPKAGPREAGVSGAGVSKAKAPKAGEREAGVSGAGASKAKAPKAGEREAEAPGAGAPEAGTPEAVSDEAMVPGAGEEKAGQEAEAAFRSEVCSYSEFFEDSDIQKNRLIEEERRLFDDIDMDAEAGLRILDPYMRKTREVMAENAFAQGYSAQLAEDVKRQLAKALPDLPAMRDFEVLLLDNIVSSFESDHGTQLYPPKFFVLAGAQGVGKTAASWKIGNVFATGLGKSVEVVRLTEGGPSLGGKPEIVVDPNGVRHSVHSCQEDLGRIAGALPMDIYIIDSFTPAPGDERSKRLLFDFYKRLPRDDAKFFLVMEASTTDREVEKLLSMFEKTDFQSIVLTKCDAAGTIGNAISVSSRFGLPLLFICDGKDLKGSISFASSFAVLSKLRGFDLDMGALAQPS